MSTREKRIEARILMLALADELQNISPGEYAVLPNSDTIQMIPGDIGGAAF